MGKEIENISLAKCSHLATEKRFIGYQFTEELFANYCKVCNKRLSSITT